MKLYIPNSRIELNAQSATVLSNVSEVADIPDANALYKAETIGGTFLTKLQSKGITSTTDVYFISWGGNFGTSDHLYWSNVFVFDAHQVISLVIWNGAFGRVNSTL